MECNWQNTEWRWLQTISQETAWGFQGMVPTTRNRIRKGKTHPATRAVLRNNFGYTILEMVFACHEFKRGKALARNGDRRRLMMERRWILRHHILWFRTTWRLQWRGTHRDSVLFRCGLVQRNSHVATHPGWYKWDKKHRKHKRT